MQFLGSPEDYKHLRDCLSALYDMGKTSGVLLKAIGAHEVRHTLDRFRKEETSQLSARLAEKLWNHIKTTYPIVFETPGVFADGADTEDILFTLLRRFFALKQPRIADFVEGFGGRYVCYTRSSLKYPNPYVTVSEMEISQTKTGAIRMKETQQYVAQGHVMKEVYSGFCMPKGTSKMMMAHDKAHGSRPRLYFITDDMDTEIDGKPKKAFFNGFVNAYSKNYGGVFHARFFCRRLAIGQRIKKDIIPRSALDDDDVDEWIFPKDS